MVQVALIRLKYGNAAHPASDDMKVIENRSPKAMMGTTRATVAAVLTRPRTAETVKVYPRSMLPGHP